MKKGFLIVLASVLLSGLTAYGIVKTTVPTQNDGQQGVAYSSDGQTVRTVNLSLSDYPDFTYAAETAVNAVVYVKVTIQARQQQQQQYIDPFFRFFFGDDGYGYGGGNRERQGSGSGVIIRSDGYIVTNNHVVSGASKIEVTLNNNKTYEATVIGTDPATDVALIKIDATGLQTVQFADSDKLRLGEWVLAIGSPLGEELRSTITAGIVSAKGRSMPSSTGEFKIESFIQTDAAVNPGNSGGALVNKEGELVGINTAIVSTTGSYTGYSFAVPSNIVKKVVSDLIDFGSVKRAMLGITGGTVTEDLAKKLKLNTPEGVYVSEVVKGGAADKAGIKAEDVILAIDGTRTATMPELQAKVNSFHPGDKATVRLIRDGKTVDLPVEFQDGSVSNGTVASDGTVSFYGAQLRAAEGGVEIVSAGNGSLARAGGSDGFIIRYVNDKKVSKPQDVIDIAKKSTRSIFIEGVDAYGRPGYFGFAKEE
ncbi:MAG: Do family serine endopeptidase [Bacteroidales bacterium]|nr:Do family serine endopeptidase [Bacteroidales bacterium]